MANYQPVSYFDPVSLADLLVCDDCGALVHPNRANKHDIEHEWSERTAERVDQIDLGVTPP